jgi:D-alanyl-D-alanine carboxypeptidase
MRPHPTSILLAAALAAAAILAAACGGSHEAKPRATRAPPPPTTTRASLSEQLEKLVAAGSPGAIAVVNDGHGVRLQAAGVADKRSGRELRATDRFRSGSNTKSLVSTVALELVGEGKLSLSDTVERRLPGVLSYGDKVNVRQLLNMTGGVADYQRLLEPKILADAAVATRSYTPRELVAMIADRKPDFAPGTSWNYSSTNYILMGMIIERVTGHSLGHELEQRIFEPLGMRHTALPLDTTEIAGSHANGYGEVDGELRDLTAFNATAAWATGGVVTTASDMARFWRALLGGKVLALEQLAAMKTTVPVKGAPVSYGLGIMKFDTGCGPLWGNGGDLPGYSSEFYNSEDGTKQAGVIVNVNPIPKAVSGEPLGVAKLTAIADSLGKKFC